MKAKERRYATVHIKTDIYRKLAVEAAKRAKTKGNAVSEAISLWLMSK